VMQHISLPEVWIRRRDGERGGVLATVSHGEGHQEVLLWHEIRQTFDGTRRGERRRLQAGTAAARECQAGQNAVICHSYSSRGGSGMRGPAVHASDMWGTATGSIGRGASDGCPVRGERRPCRRPCRCSHRERSAPCPRLIHGRSKGPRDARLGHARRNPSPSASPA
jgi:hypothetical protein